MTGACIAYLVGNVVLFLSMFYHIRGQMTVSFTPSERKMTVFLLSLIPFFLLVKMFVRVSYLLYIAGFVFTVLLILLNEWTGYFPVRELIALFKRK